MALSPLTQSGTPAAAPIYCITIHVAVILTGVQFAGSAILAVARTDGNVYFLDASDGGQQGALPTSEKLSITAGLSFLGLAPGDVDRHGTQ